MATAKCCDTKSIGKMENATFFRPRLQSHWKPLGAVTPNQLENVAFVGPSLPEPLENATFFRPPLQSPREPPRPPPVRPPQTEQAAPLEFRKRSCRHRFAKCFKDCRFHGIAAGRLCRVFQGLPPPPAPPRATFAECFKDCRPRGHAAGRFCKVSQGLPPPRHRCGPPLQSVSRIAAAVAPHRAAFAECFKDCRPRGSAAGHFCRVFRGPPPPRPRRGTFLQSVSRTAAPAAPPRATFAKCCKDCDPAAPPRATFAMCVKDCRPRGSAKARLCRVFQGLPPPRPRRGPFLQSVSRTSAAAAPPRHAFAECFKDCRPRGSSEGHFCKVCQGLPPPQPASGRLCKVFQGPPPPRPRRGPPATLHAERFPGPFPGQTRAPA